MWWKKEDRSWEDTACIFCGQVKPPYPPPYTTYKYYDKKYHNRCLIETVLKLKGEKSGQN